jgi:outer membrane lipopolysaccharide assembly protein LptE/RlpB
MTKRTMLELSSLCAITALAAGCSFHARDADSYRKVTRELLETRNPDIKSCYDAELKKDEKVSGVVVVKFTVEKETGKIRHARVDEAKTKAPQSLGQCVVSAIEGLTLDPPDARDGDATFRWEFQVKS